NISAWRWMFLVGVLPALLAVVVMRQLREPEKWKAAVAAGGSRKAGSYGELFQDPRWRHNAIVGLLLAFAGVVGLWGIGFFSSELVRAVFRKTLSQTFSSEEIAGKLQFWVGIMSLVQNAGAAAGIL